MGIRLDHITKTYTVGSHTRTVFSDFSLEIPFDKITVVVGRSGCGKSTILRLLAKLEELDDGAIHMPDDYRCTILNPEPYLISWTNVLNNIALASGAGLTPVQREVKARELMKIAQLSEYEEYTPLQLSTGMKQRLGLARALASLSQVLLMDEPFASLDFITRAELQQELLRIQEKMPRTILFVTHQLDEALLLGDRVVVLHTDGSTTDFDLSAYTHPRDIESPEMVQLRKDIMQACLR
ncbi:MAG: ATP-binding cassette domain-containing protein [Oscillospiraceae bacterium]|nr:ATP-binding cassette domain-containing protein [Oscillospiraceae bacterium]